ncbi:MAG: collagen-like protein [Chitinophagaceae bacterium]|nr:collagen-like protein [Chitinophagaceae bacterium]
MTDVVEVGRSDWVVIVAPGITETLAVPSPTLDLVEVAEQGPAGPPGADGEAGAQGPQGIPGLSGANYTHTQAVPSADWTITHNLARFPSVTVIDSAGSTVVGDIEYLSNNAIAIHFTAAFGGSAYLN